MEAERLKEEENKLKFEAAKAAQAEAARIAEEERLAELERKRLEAERLAEE